MALRDHAAPTGPLTINVQRSALPLSAAALFSVPCLPCCTMHCGRSFDYGNCCVLCTRAAVAVLSCALAFVVGLWVPSRRYRRRIMYLCGPQVRLAAGYSSLPGLHGKMTRMWVDRPLCTFVTATRVVAPPNDHRPLHACQGEGRSGCRPFFQAFLHSVRHPWACWLNLYPVRVSTPAHAARCFKVKVFRTCRAQCRHCASHLMPAQQGVALKPV